MLFSIEPCCLFNIPFTSSGSFLFFPAIVFLVGVQGQWDAIHRRVCAMKNSWAIMGELNTIFVKCNSAVVSSCSGVSEVWCDERKVSGMAETVKPRPRSWHFFSTNPLCYQLPSFIVPGCCSVLGSNPNCFTGLRTIPACTPPMINLPPCRPKTSSSST